MPADENIVYNFHCYEPLIFTHQGAGWIDTMPSDYRMSFDNDMSVFLDSTKKYLPDNMIMLEPAKDIAHALDSEFLKSCLQRRSLWQRREMYHYIVGNME